MPTRARRAGRDDGRSDGRDDGRSDGDGDDEPRWLSPEQEAAWRSLLLVHAHLVSTLGRQLAPSGLSLQDYGVLVLLSDSPDGQRRPYELAEQLGLEKTRLSHHLKRMEERGLVTRQRCPTDQRGWLIGITTAGRAALRKAAPGHVRAVREAFVDRLSPGQLRTLIEIADAVIDDRPAGRPSGAHGRNRSPSLARSEQP